MTLKGEELKNHMVATLTEMTIAHHDTAPMLIRLMTQIYLSKKTNSTAFTKVQDEMVEFGFEALWVPDDECEEFYTQAIQKGTISSKHAELAHRQGRSVWSSPGLKRLTPINTNFVVNFNRFYNAMLGFITYEEVGDKAKPFSDALEGFLRGPWKQ